MSARPSIAYVPGWGCDGDLFTEVIAALDGQADHTVVDLGAGTSRDQMVAATLAQLPARTHLVGASMGGWIAQEVAARAGDQVESLVLVSSWARPPASFPEALHASIELVSSGTWGEDLRPALLANFSPDRRDGPLPGRMLAMLDRVGRDRLVSQARAMLAAPDVTASHARISCPTQVVAADADVFFPVATQAAIVESIAAATGAPTAFEVVADSNHNLTWEQPAAVVAAVGRWCLQRVG